MKARKNLTVLRFFCIILCVISQISSAPTTSIDYEQEETSKIDSCDTKELTEQLICKANDGDCETKNLERKLKRESICALNPECPYCEHEKEEDDEIEPEIVPTINPPLNYDDDGETQNFDNDSELLELVQSPTEINIDERMPNNLIERNIVIENDNETHLYRGFVQPASNITTVIRLTNVIENNNIINVPTTLNNTNINNIHVYSNKSSSKGGKFDLGYTEDGPCCWSIKPAQCKTTTVGLKCRHKRLKTCGPQCEKKVINANRARCMQIPQYPYMMCPPHQSYPWNQPKFEDDDFNFNDDDDLPLFPEDKELEDEESGWIVHQEKCKIVSEDGLQITNCTDSNVEFENSYARNSLDIDASSRVTRNARNSKREQQYSMPYYPNQMMYGQQMFIPVVMMPQPSMNYYMPQQVPMPPVDRNIYYDEPDFERKDFHPYTNSKKHFKKIISEHDEEEL